MKPGGLPQIYSIQFIVPLQRFLSFRAVRPALDKKMILLQKTL